MCSPARRKCAPHRNECCGAAHPQVPLLVHDPHIARPNPRILWHQPTGRSTNQYPPIPSAQATEAPASPLIVPAYLASEPHALGDPSKRCCLAHDAGQPHALVKIASASAPSSTAADDRTQYTTLTAPRPPQLKDWPPGRRRHLAWNAAVPPAQHDAPPYNLQRSRATHLLVDLRVLRIDRWDWALGRRIAPTRSARTPASLCHSTLVDAAAA